MKIDFKNTPEQVELIKAAGSKNKVVAAEAQEAIAAFIAPVFQKVLLQAGTSGQIYQSFTYNEDDTPSIPLDLFYNQTAGFVTVWSQTIAGGLASSQTYGIDEFKIATFRLDSAVSISKKYARRSRLDVVSKSISKMLNEVVLKKERNAWIVLLRSLGEASTNGLSHVISATTANVFQVDDLNKLMTRARRIGGTLDGGTPTDEVGKRGITDLYCSPEVIEQVRGFAYQPMNTRAGSLTTSGATSVALPDSIREGIYRNSGVQEIYGVNLNELIELGDAQKYNALFAQFYTGSFTAATDQVAVGIDLTRDAFFSPIAQNADSGSTFDVLPDDQFVSRQDKMGFYGACEMGFVNFDSRGVFGLTI